MFKNAVCSEQNKFFHDTYGSIENTRHAHNVIKRFTSHKKRETINGSIYTDDNKTIHLVGNENIANSLADNFSKNHFLTHNNRSINEIVVSNTIREIENNHTIIRFSNQIPADIIDDEQFDNINCLLPDEQ